MKTRPILFSGEMVKAILEGRKTQTRRVVKDSFKVNGFMDIKFDPLKCPYGQPGDRLWVRETWRPLWDDIDAPGGLGDCIQYRSDMVKIKPSIHDYETGMMFDAMCVHSDANPKWHPSIHMPLWASRITLEITGLRVERVQEISFSDVFAEGAADHRNCYPQEIGYVEGLYAELWDSINAKRGYGWSVNPWVWVVEFKRVQQ